MTFKDSEIIPVQTTDSNSSPKRAKRADAVANRQLILGTAQHLFAKHGVAEVCMATIAEAAQIGKGTLYRSFANKGELCLALMDEDMRIFQDKTLQQLRENAQQAALIRLDMFLDSLTYFMEFHAPLLCEVQKHGNVHAVSPAGRASPQMWLPWLRNTIRILLQQAEQNQETEGLDIPFLADAILAPLSADLFIYQREVQGFTVERISRGVRRLALHGCH